MSNAPHHSLRLQLGSLDFEPYQHVQADLAVVRRSAICHVDVCLKTDVPAPVRFKLSLRTCLSPAMHRRKSLRKRQMTICATSCGSTGAHLASRPGFNGGVLKDLTSSINVSYLRMGRAQS